MQTPKTLQQALECANRLLTKQDEVILQSEPLEVAQIQLHLTLGHQLRSVLGLWQEDAQALFDELMTQVPNTALVIDADSASSAIIKALWLARNHPPAHLPPA